GSDLGKDIPFFLGKSKTGYVHGAGEKTRALPSLRRAHFLIVNPRIPVSTKDAYEALSQSAWFMSHTERTDISSRMVKAIESGDMANVATAFYNDFETLMERVHPVIKEIRQALMAFGAKGALMSGSGSTVFG